MSLFLISVAKDRQSALTIRSLITLPYPPLVPISLSIYRTDNLPATPTALSKSTTNHDHIELGRHI